MDEPSKTPALDPRILLYWTVFVFVLTIIIRIIPGLLVYGSEDVTAWRYAAALWDTGQDPYTQAYIFNWPPFWLNMVQGLIHAGASTGIPCHLMIKLPPILADGVIAAIIFRIFLRTSENDVKKSLAGAGWFALNPISIVITSIQGNFIAVPSALLVMAAYFQVFGTKPRNLAWASLSLGCGIMSKIWPMVALPFFLHKIASMKQRIMFLPLAGTPLIAAILPLYLKNSDMVMERFIKYQSQAGWWGFTGFGQIWNVAAIKSFCGWYAVHGSMVLLATLGVLIFLTRLVDLFRTLLIVFLSVLLLMNGFGPQYLLLVLPFAVILRSKWLMPFTILVSALFCFEYGLLPFAGLYAIPCSSQPAPEIPMAQFLRSNLLTNILRLPVWLFIGAWLATEISSCCTLTKSTCKPL